MTQEQPGPTSPLLQVHDLVKHFPVSGRQGKQVLRAVDGVSFTVNAGETVGVVGESGCGKSTVARLLVGLTKPTSGSVLVEGGDIWARGRDATERRRRLQMVFQNPTGSMNPRRTVGESVAEPLLARRTPDLRARVAEALSLVGMQPEMADRMPHEMSGGQQQRASIARAMISNPALVVHDESVASLDISLQAQILNLLVDLQDRLGTAYLFISHDLAAVQALSHRVVVMYLGEVVESAPADAFAEKPLHPYSVALRGAALLPDPEIEQSRVEVGLIGDVPSPLNPPSGCRFRTRCPFAQQKCADEKPALREVQGEHFVACHFAGVATATSALEEAS